MLAYIVATVRIGDPARFAQYVQAIAGLSEKFGGEYVLRGAIDQVLEGNVDLQERIVVIRYPSAEAALGYINSPEYQTAKALRFGAGEVNSRLVVDSAP